MLENLAPWLSVVIALLVGIAVLGLQREHRRRRLRAAPLPRDLAMHLEPVLARYPRLPHALRDELRGRVNEFIADKQFVGCNGLEVDDAMRVTIAAHACLLLLNRNLATFPNVRTILAYPTAFIARYAEHDEWLQHDIEEIRAGESWDRGPLVLAWDEVQADLAHGDDRNVIVHEFAHKLDEQNPDSDGLPPLPDPGLRRAWSRVFTGEFEALRAAAAQDEATFLDPYGAESPAEFYAVVTEAFFGNPRGLRAHHPALYRVLREGFRVDPVSWVAPK